MTTTIPEVAAVLGDVVGSRSHQDRSRLQHELVGAFDRVDQAVPAIQPFTMTIGDEFQAIFATIDDALAATLRLRLEVFGTVDVRFGIGVGEVFQLGDDTTPFEQDGPAWWRARAAIDDVEGSRSRYGWPRSWRTGWRGDPDVFDAVRAYLMVRDQIVAGFDREDAAITLALLNGERQTTMADRLGFDRSAVSRRVSAHGISAILRAEPRREGET